MLPWCTVGCGIHRNDKIMFKTLITLIRLTLRLTPRIKSSADRPIRKTTKNIFKSFKTHFVTKIHGITQQYLLGRYINSSRTHVDDYLMDILAHFSRKLIAKVSKNFRVFLVRSAWHLHLQLLRSFCFLSGFLYKQKAQGYQTLVFQDCSIILLKKECV